MFNRLNFYTSHHQIYICDFGYSQDISDDQFWTEDATHSRLAIGDGILGVGLESYGDFKGDLTALQTKNAVPDFAIYDHIVEGSLNIRSGILQVLDCPNMKEEFRVNIMKGMYRVRVYSINLSSVMGDSGEDYYKIEMWLEQHKPRTVLKQFLHVK